APARRAAPAAPLGLIALAVVPFLFLVAPLLALAWRTLPSGAWLSALGDPLVTRALALSLSTTLLSLGLTVALGTPLAYLLARYRFPGQRLIDALVDLPIVLPPAVAGLA